MKNVLSFLLVVCIGIAQAQVKSKTSANTKTKTEKPYVNPVKLTKEELSRPYMDEVLKTRDFLTPEEAERRRKNIEAANPFKKYGFYPKIATLSKGKYLEAHDLDSIVSIGSVRYNRKTKEIVEFRKIDLSDPDAQPYLDTAGRWISPDPLSEEFPDWTPYRYAFNNPLRFSDPTGMLEGDFISEDGKYLGNDGINDGKVYVVKTTQTTFDNGAKSAGITKDAAKDTEKFIKANSGNTDAFKSNNIAYANSIEIEGSAANRQSMVDIVNKDSGSGGTSDANNREYGGVIRDGVVIESPAGAVGNPKTDSQASITHPSVKKSDVTFHSHPSGQIVEGSGSSSGVSSGTTLGGTTTTYGWGKAPSSHDISNAKGTGYVFSRSNGTVYIYNGSGVNATVPQKRFVEPKK